MGCLPCGRKHPRCLVMITRTDFHQRFHGVCGGSLCAIKLEDVEFRLPCSGQIYEEDLASDAPFFDCFQPGITLQSMDPQSSPPIPAVHTMIIASIAAREQFTASFGRPSHHHDSNTKTDQAQSRTEGDGRTNNLFSARMCGGGSER